ncbi:MAG TPA: hypothetical protein VIM57_03660 [Luteolibacter sp.]
MATSSPATPETPRTLVFRLACWGCGLVAFGQVLCAAVALAARLERPRKVVVVESKTPPVPPAVAAPAGPPAAAYAPLPGALAGSETRIPDVPVPGSSHFTSLKPPVPTPEPVRPLAPTPLSTPPIADPVVEKLVTEARKLRVAEDMANAIVKLEEARSKAPGDPNIEYELGLVHEAMGVFDTASAHYEKVFQMGTVKAGKLYEMAAAKLRDGLGQTESMRGQLALGRVRIFKDAQFTEGERVVVTVPVQAAPGVKVSPNDFSVTVRFFDTLRGREIVPRSDETSRADYQWTTDIDWAGGEELLRVTYVLQKQGHVQSHLFGDRSYYGQVVELTYKNEVIDVQAWPRDLAAKIPQPPTAQPRPPQPDDLPPEFLNQDTLPPDFNPGAPLLPNKPPR